MKKQIVFICLILGAFTAKAQQDPQFTQFFDNALFANPAYAGSNDVLNITALHREQWVGFDGRPRSTSLSIHSPLSYRSVGVGLTMINDQLGPFKQNLVYGDFSYSLRFKNKSRLAFGIQGGINVINIGTDQLSSVQNDTYLVQSIANNVNPNFGFGVYYHSDRWFIGASSPKLLQQSYDGSSSNIEKRHFFASAGFVSRLNEVWQLRPIVQVKGTQGAPLSIDASVAAIFDDRFFIGGMWRPNAAFGAFVQFKVSPQFKVGLASDFGTQAIRSYNNGTYELLLSYDFNLRKQGIISPRYF